MASKAAAPEAESFFDTEPFWVIWQASIPVGGTNRIRRISQEYRTEARAQADAERYRKSGAITWVEEARPLAPLAVPAAALDALRGIATTTGRESVITIGNIPA